MEIFKENNLLGMKENGKVIVEPQYLDLGNFCEGVGVVRDKEFRYSYISHCGVLYYPFGKLSWCEPFRYGFARYKVGDKFGVLAIQHISEDRKRFRIAIKQVTAPIYDNVWSIKPEYLDCMNAMYKGREESLNLLALRGGRELEGLEYIKTYSVEEFKEIYGVEKVYVKQSKVSGRLYTLFGAYWGEVATKGIPSKPKISVVVNNKNEMFPLLHEEDECLEYFYFVGYGNAEANKKSYCSYYAEPDMSYDDEWREMRGDAFEGDSDAYWNIE